MLLYYYAIIIIVLSFIKQLSNSFSFLTFRNLDYNAIEYIEDEAFKHCEIGKL